jgi:hypothetical protein
MFDLGHITCWAGPVSDSYNTCNIFATHTYFAQIIQNCANFLLYMYMVQKWA